MMKLSIVVLLCLALAVNCQVPGKKAKPQKKLKVCLPTNIEKAKCAIGRDISARCIPEVRKVNYNQYEVKPRYFKVTWEKVHSATCYYIEVLTGHTGFVYKTRSCFKGTAYTVTGLEPWTMYGVRVSVVNKWCRRGRPSPVVRIKTYWAPTVPTTRAPRPTYTPKTGKCGSKRFTCHTTKKQCIPKKRWCDGKEQCDDGSDERYCPGGCTEIDVDFKNGNYSCSRFGSPGSFCFFDCDDPYMRDGTQYTSCDKIRGQWTHPIPVCRLSYTRVLRVLHDETTSTSVTLEWEPVEKADKYSFQAVEQTAYIHDDEFVKIETVNATTCCTAKLTGLKSGVEYRATMWAIDRDGDRGLESLPVFFKSVGPPDIQIKSG